MSSNPYSKFIIDPSTVPDPNKVTLSQFEKYSSLEMEKIGSVFRTLKRSSFYIGGVIGLCFVGALWAERRARCELFGGDSNFLAIKTREDRTWTCKLSATKPTTPTTESSSECSTWPRAQSLTDRFTASNT